MKDKKALIQEYKEMTNCFVKRKREILDALANHDELTVEDNIVTESNLCVFLSCPGEKEFVEQKVCVGQTGANLDTVLQAILKEIKDVTKSSQNTLPIRYQFSIINASHNVHFREYNSAEPSDEEILKDNNIERVKNNVNNLKLKYCIVCGDKAELLFNNLKISDVKIASICHLGNVGLRNTYRCNYSLDGIKTIGDLKESKRDEKRLELVAEKIIESFNS